MFLTCVFEAAAKNDRLLALCADPVRNMVEYRGAVAVEFESEGGE
jgi:hypothetical protein